MAPLICPRPWMLVNTAYYIIIAENYQRAGWFQAISSITFDRSSETGFSGEKNWQNELFVSPFNF